MHQVGYTTGVYQDATRTSWNGDGPRPVLWSAWYPVQSSARQMQHHDNRFFQMGDVHVDGKLALGQTFPVVMMSHGTGGSPESLGWLASKLAAQGNIVIGPHHHGNTGSEPYLPEGFLCWWERATDISALLSALSKAGPFADRLDLSRVSAVGYSLGGYAVLALAGAKTSITQYMRWLHAKGVRIVGPREFPDLADHIPRLLETSEPFRLSWQRQSDDFADPRIRSVIAIAPPPPVRGFDSETVNSIRIPVTLVTGEADTEASSNECAGWLLTTNPRFRWVSAGESVGHYTFVGFPTGSVPEEVSFIFKDNPGVERAVVHELVVKTVLGALE